MKGLKKMPNHYVSYSGKLKVKDGKLVNQYGEIIILKGISTHGIQWYSNFANKNMFESLKEQFNINAIRIAMYTEENGYIDNPNLKEKVKEIVHICTQLDLYVVIDWHVLKDKNPNVYYKEAISFFKEMSKEYQSYENIIYEICNEPNGDTSWDKDIKPYAEKIISIIRQNDSDSIIIVGTEHYSQNVDICADNPLDFKNILYSLHFYSGTHKNKLRDKFNYAINKKLPIIVSEFGVCDAETNTRLDLKEAEIWFNLLKENDVSMFNWSLSDKKEASSLLLPGSSFEKIDEKYLSESGKFIKEQYELY